jgi:hypothetical protein
MALWLDGLSHFQRSVLYLCELCSLIVFDGRFSASYTCCHVCSEVSWGERLLLQYLPQSWCHVPGHKHFFLVSFLTWALLLNHPMCRGSLSHLITLSDTQTHTGKHTDTHTDAHRHTHTDTHRHTDTQTHTYRHTDTHTGTQTNTDTQTDT